MNIIITEGVEGFWYYHLSKPETFNRSLCGKRVMITNLPLSSWGTVTHLNEKYCKDCEQLKNMYAIPLPPQGSQHCDICGVLKNGKHTNLLCRFMNWIDRIVWGI